MNPARDPRQSLAAFALTLTLSLSIAAAAPPLRAQHMHGDTPSTPSTTLTLQGLAGKTLTLTAPDLAALPHQSVTVTNGHSKTQETYSGVPLSNLLAKVGVPHGPDIKGPLFLLGVIAEGTDGYRVLFSLTEIDPALHTGDILVADSLDGKPLLADGAFKLVASEDRRPARWVRNLKSISLINAKP